jgi:hypothetical protein
MKAKLTQIETNHSRLRTKVIDGDSVDIPRVGTSFVIIGPALESGDFRIVTTSEVKEVKEVSETLFQFKTLNSLYEVEILSARLVPSEKPR